MFRDVLSAPADCVPSASGKYFPEGWKGVESDWAVRHRIGYFLAVLGFPSGS